MNLRQPVWPRFLPTSVVLAIARVGPCGRARRAPGTWGSLAGLLLQLLVFHHLAPPVAVLLCVMLALFSVAFCGEAEFRLGAKDPGEIVLDEFVAMPVCLLGWQSISGALSLHWAWTGPWSVYLAAFALFRFFDIVKPFGIARLQKLPAGWGVTLDDTGAALATSAALHAGALALRVFAQT
jgi:phosphatidylglycerophosphatase A